MNWSDRIRLCILLITGIIGSKFNRHLQRRVLFERPCEDGKSLRDPARTEKRWHTHASLCKLIYVRPLPARTPSEHPGQPIPTLLILILFTPNFNLNNIGVIRFGLQAFGFDDVERVVFVGP